MSIPNVLLLNIYIFKTKTVLVDFLLTVIVQLIRSFSKLYLITLRSTLFLTFLYQTLLHSRIYPKENKR